MYKIPAEFETDEKIIGGLLTLKQFVLVIAGVVPGVAFMGMPVPLFVKFLFLAVLSGIGFAAAFYKNNGLDLITLAIRYLRYRSREKKVKLFNFKEDSIENA